MTQEVFKMWNELVDANWELSKRMSWDNMERYKKAKAALITEVGQAEYNRFIENGRKMFGVKQSYLYVQNYKLIKLKTETSWH